MTEFKGPDLERLEIRVINNNGRTINVYNTPSNFKFTKKDFGWDKKYAVYIEMPNSSGIYKLSEYINEKEANDAIQRYKATLEKGVPIRIKSKHDAEFI